MHAHGLGPQRRGDTEEKTGKRENEETRKWESETQPSHFLTCSPTVSLSPSHFLPFASSRFHVFPFSCFNSEIRNPKSALVFLTQVNQQHLTSMVAGEALEQFYASVGVSVAQRNRHDSRS